MANLLAQRMKAWRTDPIRFADEVLRGADGKSYGRGLDPWQREDLQAALSGGRHVWWERPRGHSKTMDAAAVALTDLVLGGPGRRVYFGATDRDQAGLALDSLRGFIRRSELLQSWVRLLTHEVVVDSLDSKLEVLSADAASSWGLRPSLIVVDELEAWRGVEGEEFFWSLFSSLGKIKGARMLVCSTAGWDRCSLCWKLRDQVQNDPAWDFRWRGQVASWIDPAFLEAQKRILPAHVYRMLHENLWSDAGGAFLTSEEVENIFDPSLSPRDSCAEGEHFLGLDLGLVRDASAAVVLHAGRDGVLTVDAIRSWQGSRRERVELSAVEDWLREAVKAFSWPELVADPWQTIGMLQRLSAAGVRVREAAFSPSFRDRLFSTLLQIIREKRIRCYPHERLRDELLSLSFTDKNGVLRVDHRPGGHDDHVMALALACFAATEAGSQAPAPVMAPITFPLERPPAWRGDFDSLSLGRFDDV